MAKKQSIEELVTEQSETEIVEQVEVTVEEVAPKTHTVNTGDTWVSISELYRGSKTNKAYAQELIAKNGVNLNKGAIINL